MLLVSVWLILCDYVRNVAEVHYTNYLFFTLQHQVLLHPKHSEQQNLKFRSRGSSPSVNGVAIHIVWKVHKQNVRSLHLQWCEGSPCRCRLCLQPARVANSSSCVFVVVLHLAADIYTKYRSISDEAEPDRY